MKSLPPSPHFSPISLSKIANANRAQVGNDWGATVDLGYGTQTFQGIPFDLGSQSAANLILLNENTVTLDLNGIRASYLLFLHVVEDRVTNYLDGFADFSVDGNELGDHVSDYELHYADGECQIVAIRRRFAIQQSHIRWGASPFEAIPATPSWVFPTANEEMALGRVPGRQYGRGETRHESSRNDAPSQLWLYALPNPHPDKPLKRLRLEARGERSAIFGITASTVTSHPLKAGVRRKLRLTLPDGVSLNKLGELDEIGIDMGIVISARAVLDYDAERWLGDDPNVQPSRSTQAVTVEYSAHPQARLYVGERVYDSG